MAASQAFVDIDKIIKDWAWSQYKELESFRQKRLRKKEEQSGKIGKYIDVRIDWTSVTFRDETDWTHINDDVTEGSGGQTGSGKTGKPGSDAGPTNALVLYETKYTNNTSKEQEYTLRTEKTTSSSLDTSVESGYTFGMEMGITLKAPGEVLELNAGYRKEFQLTSTKGETFEETLTWSLESKVLVERQHVAEARMLVNEKKQSGEFVIKSHLSGTVRVTFTSVKDNNSFIMAVQHNIVKILKVIEIHFYF